MNSEAESQDHDGSQNVTFAFGHVVGDGIQQVMEGKTENEIYFKMFCDWHADLEDRNEKQNKSFYMAVAAIQRFISLRANGFLEDYELVYYNGKPATELSFRITFPDGFTMRGSVDAVLRHKTTGKILVLECKTSSSNSINAATYKNSSQAIGYSVVLDVIFPELSSYDVLYLVYKTKDMSYEMLPFTKSYLQRALWIQELLLDIETIKLYESAGVYPMRGESCVRYMRECDYFNLCTLSTDRLTKPVEVEYDENGLPLVTVLDPKEYHIELSLMDLVNAQTSKIGIGETA
jgi:hypothetical protein